MDTRFSCYVKTRTLGDQMSHHLSENQSSLSEEIELFVVDNRVIDVKELKILMENNMEHYKRVRLLLWNDISNEDVNFGSDVEVVEKIEAYTDFMFITKENIPNSRLLVLIGELPPIDRNSGLLREYTDMRNKEKRRYIRDTSDQEMRTASDTLLEFEAVKHDLLRSKRNERSSLFFSSILEVVRTMDNLRVHLRVRNTGFVGEDILKKKPKTKPICVVNTKNDVDIYHPDGKKYTVKFKIPLMDSTRLYYLRPYAIQGKEEIDIVESIVCKKEDTKWRDLEKFEVVPLWKKVKPTN